MMKTGNNVTAKKCSTAVLTAAALVGMVLALPAQSAPLKSKVEMVVTFDGKDRTVILELDEVNAPRTSQNFRKLASSGFYDGLLFHRVIPGYIIQAGDPLSKDAAKRPMWGTGGPGYTVPAELGQPHLKGSLAAARLGDGVNPDKESSGSQFYIALDKIPSLDGEYTVFGNVLSGLEDLVAIGNAATDESAVPTEQIIIKSTKVIDDNPAPQPAPAPVETTKVETPTAPPVVAETPKPVSKPDPIPTPVERRPEDMGIRDITPRQSQPNNSVANQPTPPEATGTPTGDAPASDAPASDAPTWAPGQSGAGTGTADAPPAPKKKAGPVTKFLKRFW